MRVLCTSNTLSPLCIGLALALLCFTPVLSQAANCSYSLSPANTSVSSALGGGSFTVTTGTTCAWSANPSNSWLHTTSSGTGNGTVNFTVDPNPSASSRTGIIGVAGKSFTVTQSGMPPTLAQGLENASLVWETSPDFPWYGTNPPAPTYDGLFSAASGNRNVANSSSWLRTTLIGPGTLTFWWKVDSEIYPPPPDTPWSVDSLQFALNDTVLDQIMGQVDWNYRSFDIPSGTNTVTWQYVKDAQFSSYFDCGWVSQVTYSTNTPMALQEALNTCGVTWTSGGNTNPTLWSGQAAVTHDGHAAARSGAITSSQESWLETTVSAVTNVSFWWQVSSETNADWLEFYTNGSLAKRISGEVAWQSNYFKLSAGTNTLRWRYVKDVMDIFAKGQDCAWLDQVTFGPPPKGSPYYLAQPVRTPEGNFQLLVSGEAGCPCSVQISTDLSAWTSLTNFITPAANTLLLDTSAIDAPTRFYRALSPASF